MDSTNTALPLALSNPDLLSESFTGTTPDLRSWILGPSRFNTNLPILTAQSGIDTPGNGALRLTTSRSQQASFALYNQPIATSGGLSIEFDFASYGGSGADGITFFLADGNSTPTLSGAPGGSLGYATSRYSDHPGLVGGYIGIGYDEFGGFSDPGNSAPGGPGNRPDSISLRGSAQNQYKYLTGTSTLPSSIDNPAPNANRTNSTRRTKIDLTASGSLSVSIDLNNDQDYSDPGELAIQNYSLIATNGPLPNSIKLGFTASNGDQTNIHEIRNLTVGTNPTLPLPGGSFDIGSLTNSLTYTENQPALVIAPALTLSLGSKTLDQVSVRILGNYADGQDRLTIAGQTGPGGIINGLTWAFEPGKGILTISGSGTPDAYQSALQKVAYLNSSENPTLPPRTLEVTLLAIDGAIVTKNITLNVIAVDDPAQLRVITQEGVQSGTPGATVGPVFVTDFDNTYSLTVSDSRFEIISNGPNTGILKLKDEQAITAPVTLTITGTDNSVSPAITFSQPVEIGVFTLPNPSSGITISGFPANGFTYTPRTSPSPIASSVTLSGGTGSSTTIGEATVSLSGPNFNLTQDRLGITGQTGESGTVDGLTWVYNPATGILTLNGPGNTTTYQSALQKVTYTNSSPSPATGARGVTYTVTSTSPNGSSSTSGAFSINVGSTLPNSGLSGLGEGLNYTTGAAPGTIAAGLTVTASSGSQFNGATVSVSNNFTAAQDRLGITGQTGTSGTVSGLAWTYDPATGILTLSGPGDAAAYQAALRQVTYSNTSSSPSLLPRTLTFNLGGTTGASGLAIVNFSNINAAPTAISLSNTSVGYAATGAIVGNLTTTDADSTAFSYTVSDPRFEIVSGQLKLKLGETIATPTSVNITTYDGIIGAPATQSFVQSFTLVPRLPEIFLRDYSTSADSALFYINNASTLASIRYLSLAGQTAPERFQLPTKWRAEAVGDLNRDGINDVIYRNTTNGEQTAYIVFLGEGGRVIGQDYVKFNNTALSIADNANWQIKGLSDMNGDGTLDIIWHNAEQDSTAIWSLPGTGSTDLLSAAFLTRPGGAAAKFNAPGTRLVGIGDFDGDGLAEFLYRNNAIDRTTLWKLNGSEVVQEQVLTPTNQAGWEIKLVADFNSDGRADIAWQNPSLDLSATWISSPATSTIGPIANTPAPGYFLPKPGANWSFEATADFNNDGTNDIVLRNKVTDTLRLWTLKDGQFLADNVIANGTSTFILGNPGWDVEGAGQFGATPA
jgi:FG-GAP-like repeat